MKNNLIHCSIQNENEMVISEYIKEDSSKLAECCDTLNRILKQNNIIGLDTEYLPHRNPWKRKLCYIQIGGVSTSEICILSPFYFYCLEDLFYNWLKMDNSIILCFYCMADLSVLVTNCFKNLNLHIFHFKIFDFHLFFRLLAPNFKTNSLKDWALRALNLKLDKQFQKIDWRTVQLTKEHINYMVSDVTILFKFLKCLHTIERKSSSSYWKNSWLDVKHGPIFTSLLLDHALIPIYLQMSINGVRVDINKYKLAIQETKQNLEEQSQAIQLTNSETRSAKKIQTFLENSKIEGMDICLERWPRTPKSNQLITAKKDLTVFLIKNMDLNAECVEWIQKLLQIKNTETVLKNLDQYSFALYSGCIYPNWNIIGSKTGRIITSNPNLNSTPRLPLFRKMFVSSPNTTFIINDLSMIEIVIMATLANESTMLVNLIDGKDLHIFLASKILNQTYESLMALKETDPKEFKRIRTLMKALNFGLLYGMGPAKLWEKLGEQNMYYSHKEVEEMYKTWHNTFPEVRHFHYKCKRIANRIRPEYPILHTNTYITSVLGRICRKDTKETTYFNFPIQGTCADILKLSLCLFLQAQTQGTISKDIVVKITAHDEIVFETPTNIAEMTQATVQKIMLSAAHFILKPFNSKINVGVESNIGGDWSEKP